MNEQQIPVPDVRLTEPILCYVEPSWAWFTTQPLGLQQGDDWNSAPYQHNAEPPHRWDPVSDAGRAPWLIVRVAFAGDSIFYPFDETPGRWSVDEINHNVSPWLKIWGDEGTSETRIMAGTPLRRFIQLMAASGCDVWLNHEASLLINALNGATR